MEKGWGIWCSMLGRVEHFLRPRERPGFGASVRQISLSEGLCCYSTGFSGVWITWANTKQMTKMRLHGLQRKGQLRLPSQLMLWISGQAWFASPSPGRKAFTIAVLRDTRNSTSCQDTLRIQAYVMMLAGFLWDQFPAFLIGNSRAKVDEYWQLLLCILKSWRRRQCWK